MEFKRTGEFSKLSKCSANEADLINSDDVLEMLKNIFLHDIHAHFIVTKEGTYDDTQNFSRGISPDRIAQLERAHKEGCTIVIKDLENWNKQIIQKCASYGSSTNVHLYLSPENGSGFGWHTDDRDVYIYGQIGEKSFEIKEPNGEIASHHIKKGDVLFIPYGAPHRAMATNTPSVHLSFGVWPKNMTIKDQYDTFDLPIELSI